MCGCFINSVLLNQFSQRIVMKGLVLQQFEHFVNNQILDGLSPTQLSNARGFKTFLVSLRADGSYFTRLYTFVPLCLEHCNSVIVFSSLTFQKVSQIQFPYGSGVLSFLTLFLGQSCVMEQRMQDRCFTPGILSCSENKTTAHNWRVLLEAACAGCSCVTFLYSVIRLTLLREI